MIVAAAPTAATAAAPTATFSVATLEAAARVGAAQLATLAPEVLSAVEKDESWGLVWGRAPHSHGRVFVTRRYIGKTVYTVHLDGRPIWESREADSWGGFGPARWVPQAEGEWRVAHRRHQNRLREAARQAALAAAVAAVDAGVPLVYYEGQEGGCFTLPPGTRLQLPEDLDLGELEDDRGLRRVSAWGLRRRLGLTPLSWYGEEWEEWQGWVESVTHPDRPGSGRLPRKAGWEEWEEEAA